MKRTIVLGVAILLGAGAIAAGLMAIAANVRAVSREVASLTHQVSLIGEDVRSLADDVAALTDALTQEDEGSDEGSEDEPCPSGASAPRRRDVLRHAVLTAQHRH